MANYVSEATRFLTDLKHQKPKLEEEQRNGRALLWDRTPIDLDEINRRKASGVPQQGYVYQTHN